MFERCNKQLSETGIEIAWLEVTLVLQLFFTQLLINSYELFSNTDQMFNFTLIVREAKNAFPI